MNVLFYTAMISFGIIVFGLIVGYFDSVTKCDLDPFLCGLFLAFNKMPTWVGAFVSVFASTALAFNYNIKKQRIDERNKKFDEEIESINKSLALINECLVDLTKIKKTYYGKFKKNQNIERVLSYNYTISESFSKKYLDANSISFLIENGVVDYLDPRNPLYIKGVVESTNSIIAIYNERNILAREFQDYLQKNVKSQHGKAEKNIDYNVIVDFGLIKIENLMFITENLILEIDKQAPRLLYAIYELQEIAKTYFSETYGKKKYRVFYGMPSDKDKEMLLDSIVLNELEDKIERFVAHINNQNKKEWVICLYPLKSISYSFSMNV